MLPTLIYDRTKQDVDRAQYLRRKALAGALSSAEKNEWLSPLRGAINAADFERMAQWVNDCIDLMQNRGYIVPAKVKTDWSSDLALSLQDVSTLSDTINQLAASIGSIPEWRTLPYSYTVSMEYANDLEWDIAQLHAVISSGISFQRYSGQLYSGGVV